MEIYAAVEGNVKRMEEVKDEVFAKKMLGDGIAIEPSSNQITSPCSGEVTMVFPTKHAVGIKMADGNELLIHIGVDTVELDGKPFVLRIKVGDYVKTGTTLGNVDFDYIRKQGYITDVLIISTTSKIRLVKDTGKVNNNDIVYETIGKDEL